MERMLGILISYFRGGETRLETDLLTRPDRGRLPFHGSGPLSRITYK
jgi:hypothetical protein